MSCKRISTIIIMTCFLLMPVLTQADSPEPTGSSEPAAVQTTEIVSSSEADENLVIFQEGIASWYAGEFDGKLTANGEVYDASGISAAHKELAFGTIVRVTNLDNGLILDVRINDRGPYIGDRILDLSRGAAELLGMVEQGIVPVTLELVFVPEIPESAYDRPGDTGWVKIQVGAFSSAERTLERYMELMSAGFFPIIEPTAPGGYRLLIRWLRYEDLPAYTLALVEIEISDILVMSETPQD